MRGGAVRPWPALALALVLLPGSAAGSEQKLPGEKLFRMQCAACHATAAGEPNRMGPNLFGIVGKRAGQVSGAAYSPYFRKALDGRTWNEALLDQWLEDPQEVAPGTVMMYSQADPEKRQAIIDYLKSLR